MINTTTACHLVDAAIQAIHSSPNFHQVLDDIPAALYVADSHGTITYYNQACVALAGRTPQPGADKWCVTWKMYTPDGQPLPHDQCPMAVAIRERREVRDVEAIGERPDGSRFHFQPFPTPLFDRGGRFAGAVNLLLDVSEQRKPEYLRRQADRCRRLAESMIEPDLAETLILMAAKYDEQSLRFARGGA